MNSSVDTAIQWLSSVLGSAVAVAVAALGFEAMVTVVLDIVVVLVVAAAGFSEGYAVVLAPGDFSR